MKIMNFLLSCLYFTTIIFFQSIHGASDEPVCMKQHHKFTYMREDYAKTWEVNLTPKRIGEKDYFLLEIAEIKDPAFSVYVPFEYPQLAHKFNAIKNIEVIRFFSAFVNTEYTLLLVDPINNDLLLEAIYQTQKHWKQDWEQDGEQDMHLDPVKMILQFFKLKIPSDIEKAIKMAQEIDNSADGKPAKVLFDFITAFSYTNDNKHLPKS